MSIFIQNSNISSAPWSSKKSDKGNSYEILDAQNRVVARVPVYQNVQNLREQDANLSVMTSAPELLAALREAAYHLDKAGVPLRQEFYDLINRASSTMPAISGPRNKQ
jgi:hypothetical protein